MNDKFILTETKTVTMTPESKITVTSKRLEIVDALGKFKTIQETKDSKIELCDTLSEIWREAL